MCFCYTYAKRSHTHVKDPVAHVRGRGMDYGNNKISQHALKMIVMASFVTDGHYRKKKKKFCSSIAAREVLRNLAQCK